jgi:hypothetical protein
LIPVQFELPPFFNPEFDVEEVALDMVRLLIYISFFVMVLNTKLLIIFITFRLCLELAALLS